MKRLPSLAVTSLVMFLLVAACHAADQRTPASPSVSPTVTPTPTPTPTPSPGARLISIGEVVEATVSRSAPPCDTRLMTDAPDPCLHFVVSVPSAGELKVNVTWDDRRAWMALWMGLGPNANETANSNVSLSGRLAVTPGAYEFAVALHAPAPATDAQSFRLATALQ